MQKGNVKETALGHSFFNPQGARGICEFLEMVPVPGESARDLMGSQEGSDLQKRLRVFAVRHEMCGSFDLEKSFS